MNLWRTRTSCTEICKTINNAKPKFMENLFKFRKTNTGQRQQYRLNLEIQKSNNVMKGLRIQGN